MDSKRKSNDELKCDIRLTMVDGIGSLLTERLFERFGSAENVFTAARADLMEVQGIGAKLADAIVNAPPLDEVERTMELCQREGISIVHRTDSRYPSNLLEIHDPPVLLYIKGTVLPQDKCAIAIVGTRGMSYYGKKHTRLFANALARTGFTIVSGLARGIDGVAHEAAIEAGGRTIAVLGSGLLNIFPPEHKALAESITEHGAIISEFSPFTIPQRGNFPRRNRIVSGLSLGVLVTESPRKSGSLITARMALEQNRDVWAVPGPIDQENSRGCHMLIKEGAALVENIDDIISQLAPLDQPVVHPDTPAPVHHPQEMLLNERESTVLKYIGKTPVSVDVIIEQTGLPASQVIGIISVLEFRKIVRRAEGNTVSRR